MIKNIIFDLGGVILDLDREKVIDAFNRLGFEQADRLLNNFLQKGIFMELENGTADRYDLYDHIRRSTGRDVPARAIDDALNNFIVGLAPYKLRMLEKLGTIYDLYVLSNTNEIMFPEIDRIWFGQQGHDSEYYFDRIFLSYKMNKLKPDPEIFRQVALQAAILPEDTLFIDDGEHNVAAAAALGFATYRPSPEEDLRPALAGKLGLPENFFD